MINIIPNPSLVLFCQVKPLTKAEGNYILGADGNSYCYKQSKCKILEKLHYFMASYEGLGYLLQNNHKLFREIFKFFPTEEKKKTLNRVLSSFVYHFQMDKKDKYGCPWYQPSSTNAQMRLLFAAFKTNYG